MTMQMKQCPNCRQLTNLQATECCACGHRFRTQFAHPERTQPERTQMVVGAPSSPPSAPYPPQGQAPGHYTPLPQGYQPPYTVPAGYIQIPPGAHSTVIAFLLSFFCIPGIAQLYNKQTGKGLVVIALSLGFSALGFFLALTTLGAAMVFTWPIGMLIWLLAITDATLVASRLGRGELVAEWQFF